MSSAEKSFEALLSGLHKMQQDLPRVLAKAAKEATIRAVEAAAEATPPPEGAIRGANTVTGELRQHWATDSVIEPTRVGDAYQTQLNNAVPYAPYVNDGHRMDKHFVPGLVINESTGVLEYNPDKKGGITVGTKTSYVKGAYMTEKGVEEYQKALSEILGVEIKEVLKI